MHDTVSKLKKIIVISIDFSLCSKSKSDDLQSSFVLMIFYPNWAELT